MRRIAGIAACLWAVSALAAPQPAPPAASVAAPAQPPVPSSPAPSPPAPSPPTVAPPDPGTFAIGGLKLGMTPAEAETALRGRDFDSQTIRRPTADGHDTFIAALLLRSKAVKPRAAARPAPRAGDRPGDKPAELAAAPVEQVAVVFSQFAGNRATEILRLHRYGADELVGDAKLRAALLATYGLTLPPLGNGPDAPDTLVATRAFPQHSPEPPASALPKIAALAVPAAPDVPAPSPSLAKLPDCASIADHAGFDMALLASDPGLAAMPLWTGFIPGCGVTLSISAHRAVTDASAYDLIFQHIVDQGAALADLEALRAARQQAAAAAAKAKQEAAAGHAPSL